MNNISFPETSDNHDEYPEVTQADLDRAVFRIGLKNSLIKYLVSIFTVSETEQ